MLLPGTVDQREHARVQPGVADGLGDGLADEFAGARVGVVGLEDHGAAGGEGGGGVAARRREGQREVARTKNGDGTQRDLPLADVRARQRSAVRQRRVDPDAAVVPLADDAGEEPELAGGARPLALEPGGRQSGLEARSGDEFLADRLDVPGNGLKEPGVGFRVERAEGGVGRGGRCGGVLQLFPGEQRVAGFEPFVAWRD